MGSVPQTVLAYWLDKQLGVDAGVIDVIHQGASQVQQSLLTGAVDGAAILEPVVSIVKNRLDDARVVAKGEAMFPGQPGAVLAVRAEFIEAHPEVVERLVAAHDIQEVTVKLHVKTLCRKMGAKNRTQAAMLARDQEMV